MNNFTENQLAKIYTRVTTCQALNTKVGSNAKVEDMKVFTDELDNLFLSYLSISSIGDKTYETFYLKYDKEGNEIILNRSGFTSEELVDMFSRLKPMKLTI